MKSIVPEFSLLEIVKCELNNQEMEIDYYVASFCAPMQLSKFPHRASYFGVAVCTKGSAVLFADLEHYHLSPGSLIVMGPEVIRSWKAQSSDYAEETLFFTAPFLVETTGKLNLVKEFSFFQNEMPKVVQITLVEINLINSLLQDIKNLINSTSGRKDEMVGSYIHIILNQIADLYDKYDHAEFVKSNTQERIVKRFKQLLTQHYLHLRTVNGYADLLNLSPKHLSQTIKETTGRTAREWIHDILILEAKVKLTQTSLSVTQIADALNFSDPSLFGKYFKRYAGYSPVSYRKRLSEL